jgi:hypothetical protein
VRGPRHACVADHCPRTIPVVQAMCGDHWFRVPPKLRAAVLGARCQGAWTDAYRDALRAAVVSLREGQAS